MAAVPIALVLQIVSLAQQFSHLFAPAAGERPFVLTVFALTVVVGLAGVVAGMLAAAERRSRALGMLGAALGGALLLLFLIASAFLWNLLGALSAPV